MTINKSHCTHPQNIKVLFSTGQQGKKTTNVVYTEVFRDLND